MSDQEPRLEPGRDRRVPFFLIAAAACVALYYPTPPDFRWVPAWLAVVYVVLALLTWLDHRTKTRL